ncbi:hypothetical protein ACSSS7_004543 [Eimeria intestinalis]
MTRSSSSHHEPCILVRSHNSRTSSPRGPPSPENDSFQDGLSSKYDKDEALEISCPPLAPSDTMLRLGTVILLAFSMLIGGTILFIKGFFLSRDDLPYISNGRDLPFPPLFPHLHPHSLHLKREEGAYYVLPNDKAPQTSDAIETLQAGEELVRVNLESFLSPQLSSMATKAETCDAADCKTSWVSVTPYDRAMILLIDAMRFDFVLWDPDATNTCENKATLECEPAPPTLRPFYRNRLPFAHDLLRRSDSELKQFLSYLLKRELAKDTDDRGDGSSQADVNISGFDDSHTVNSNSGASKAQAPPTRSWGGNRFTRLYIFEADAPTATTQRLTGLATGSMPSFFSGCQGRRHECWVMMWVPGDRGLYRKSDWSFLVGHALGVDHVGHGDILDSEFMWKKLTEVNDMLKSTTKMILEDAENTTAAAPLQTLFLFFGDHGMTESGGHGGGSSEENHGALSDVNGRRRVRSDGNSRQASPTPTLGYGSRRVRQVGLAPTLSLILGLPIPFNSMGQVIADLVPALSSFVKECAQHLAEVSAAINTCDHSEGKPCIGKIEAAEAIAPTVRCSDLAYLTQLHHITAWQQYRAIKAHATVTGNDSILTDSRFAAARARWLNLYSSLDREIKALPPEAHIQLARNGSHSGSRGDNSNMGQTLLLRNAETSEDELMDGLRRYRAAIASSSADETRGDNSAARANDAQNSRLSSALPSLVLYLSAAADFSQEAFLASVRQLGTFNMQLMWCGIFMTLSSLVILFCASLLLSNTPGGFTRDTPHTQVESGLPKMTTFIWWFSISAGVGSLIWIVAWACCETIEALDFSLSDVTDVILWRQLPFLCLTGASCFLAFLFAKRTLKWFPSSASLKTFGLLQAEKEPLVEERQVGGRLAAVLLRETCLSRLWLNLFGGGRLLCYSSLFALCLMPFNDCLVNRECAIVRFLTVVYCMSAGLATFGTPCGGVEKTRIVSACAGLILCIRLGSAFDLAENTSEGEGVARQALQIDTVSSAVLFMFCISHVVGKEKLSFFPRALEQKSKCASEDAGLSRFREFNFRPLRGWRPCTMERILYIVQGALVLLWFTTPQDSKSQQPASQESAHSQALHSSFLHDCVAWLWGVVVWPFEAIDHLGSKWLAPLKQWMFSAPPSLLRVLPEHLEKRGQVKFLETLHIFLPWLVFAMTGGSWLRLVLVLCRIKKRENNISTIQLRRLEAELTNTENELASCSQMNERTRLAHRSRSERTFFHCWLIEFWDYFAHYLLLTAMCPLCMYAMLLGRSQLWPLLLCCVEWRLLHLLSRVIVLPAPLAGEVQSGSAACGCCFCRAKPAAVACESAVSRPDKRPCSKEDVGKLHGEKRIQFLLSESSICMLAGLLALDSFFATGHRMKLSAVPVEAGFIGLSEFHPVWSVVTSFLHTYLSYMICCPFIFMIIFSRLAHLAAAGTDLWSSNEGKDPQTSTAGTVVQKTLFKSAKVAFRCVFLC